VFPDSAIFADLDAYNSSVIPANSIRKPTKNDLFQQNVWPIKNAAIFDFENFLAIFTRDPVVKSTHLKVS